jgi:hypothetical protein
MLKPWIRGATAKTDAMGLAAPSMGAIERTKKYPGIEEKW